MALTQDAMSLSEVCDCDISWSYSLTFVVESAKKNLLTLTSL